jgi:acid phosphatase
MSGLWNRLWICILSALLLIGSFGLAGCGGAAGTNSTNSSGGGGGGGGQVARHVVVVVEENKDYSEVIGNTASMPFLNGLATQYAVATNYFANDQPSSPNYFMLTAGIITSAEGNPTLTVADDNIVRELSAAGKTWKVYAESLPSVGYLGTGTYPYIQWHNPFVFFNDVKDSPQQQQNVVPFTQFATDLAANTLPDYAFIVPNDENNSHDCPTAGTNCNLQQMLANADHWLQTNIGPLTTNALWPQMLLVVMYDEAEHGNTTNGGGQVACILAGGNIKKGFQSTTFYQHQSTLRLTMKYLGVTAYPGAAATAPDMDEFFTTAP